VPLRVYIVTFLFDLHSAAVFDSHMSCCATAMPFWKRLIKATAQHGMGAASAWHGMAWHDMCELASAVERRLFPSTTRSSTEVVIRNIPISNLNAGGRCETKQRLLKLNYFAART
jgi:hypothetical protein